MRVNLPVSTDGQASAAAVNSVDAPSFVGQVLSVDASILVADLPLPPPPPGVMVTFFSSTYIHERGIDGQWWQWIPPSWVMVDDPTPKTGSGGGDGFGEDWMWGLF